VTFLIETIMSKCTAVGRLAQIAHFYDRSDQKAEWELPSVGGGVSRIKRGTHSNASKPPAKRRRACSA
ncbi:MAG: hypothetical protein ACJ8I3_22815, partial [Paraburkholderia graminis]